MNILKIVEESMIKDKDYKINDFFIIKEVINSILRNDKRNFVELMEKSKVSAFEGIEIVEYIEEDPVALSILEAAIYSDDDYFMKYIANNCFDRKDVGNYAGIIYSKRKESYIFREVMKNNKAINKMLLHTKDNEEFLETFFIAAALKTMVDNYDEEYEDDSISLKILSGLLKEKSFINEVEKSLKLCLNKSILDNMSEDKFRCPFVAFYKSNKKSMINFRDSITNMLNGFSDELRMNFTYLLVGSLNELDKVKEEYESKRGRYSENDNNLTIENNDMYLKTVLLPKYNSTNLSNYDSSFQDAILNNVLLKNLIKNDSSYKALIYKALNSGVSTTNEELSMNRIKLEVYIEQNEEAPRKRRKI